MGDYEFCFYCYTSCCKRGKDILLIFFFLFSFSMFAVGQAPLIEWQKSLGGSLNDSATCIKQTMDGGYIMTGYTRSNNDNVSMNHGGADVWVVKLTSTGTVNWQKTYGGTGDDKAFCIEQCKDGGYIVAGYTNSDDGDIDSNRGGYDYWVIKLNDTGGVNWKRTYGGSGFDEAYGVVQTMGGGYIVAGWSDSPDGDVSGLHQNGGDPDYWIVKLDDTGAISWQKCYGGYATDFAYCIQQTRDSGYIISGFTVSEDGDVIGLHGLGDCWVIKLNDTGKISWAKTYGGENDEYAYCIQQTREGGYIFAGSTSSALGDVTGLHNTPFITTDYWVVKLNDTGKISWEKCYGGSRGEIAFSIVQTTDSGYIIAGGASSKDGDVTGIHKDMQGQIAADYWVVKITDTGAVSWEECYGGTKDEVAMSVQQTTDGGYIVAGFSDSNDSDVSGNHGAYDCWVVKLNANTDVPVINSKYEVSVYPNPISDNLVVESSVKGVIEIFDIVGRRVFSNEMKDTKMFIDFKSFEKGVYFLEVVYCDGSREVREIIKE